MKKIYIMPTIWMDDYEPMPKKPNYYVNEGPGLCVNGRISPTNQITWQRVSKLCFGIWISRGQKFQDWDTCFKKIGRLTNG